MFDQKLALTAALWPYTPDPQGPPPPPQTQWLRPDQHRVPVQHDVLRLQVPVDDAVLVKVVQGKKNLTK